MGLNSVQLALQRGQSGAYDSNYSSTTQGVKNGSDLLNSLLSAFTTFAEKFQVPYVSNNAFNAQQAQLNRDFQKQSAKEAMDFSAEQAQINRDWQENMSNTAFQRAVADMKKAGINPILAYTQGGASTPAGSAPSGVSASGSMASGSGSFAPTSKLRDIVSLLSASSSALGEFISSSNIMSTLSGILSSQRNDKDHYRYYTKYSLDSDEIKSLATDLNQAYKIRQMLGG